MNRQRAIAAVTLAIVCTGAVALAIADRRENTRVTTAGNPRASSTTAGPSTTLGTPSTTLRTTTTVAAVASTVPSTIEIASPPPTAVISVGEPTTAVTIAPQSTPPAGGSLAALRGHTIAIDAGHNGGNGANASDIARSIFIGTQSRACDTTGTQTDDGYTESEYNFDVAVRLQRILAGAGAQVVMSRTSNGGWGPCIDERAAFANRAHASVALSIHADGGPSSGRGFHVNMPALTSGYTDDIYSASHQLGVDVRDAFSATGMPASTYIGAQGLVERSDLGGLNLSDVPKVMVETGNMRNATDTELLQSSDFRERAARALAVGLARYLANA